MASLDRCLVATFISAAAFGCGHVVQTDTSGASMDAGSASTDAGDALTDSAGGPTARRACSPLAPPAFLYLEAVTPDGHYLVGTGEPSTPSAPAALRRLFYGTPDRMVEARVTGMQFGCAWYPSFDVDGESYSAVVAYPSCTGADEQSRIYGDGGDPGVPKVQPLTVLVREGSSTDAGAAVSTASFTFFCF